MKAMPLLIFSTILEGSYYHLILQKKKLRLGSEGAVIQTDVRILEISCSATPFVASTDD